MKKEKWIYDSKYLVFYFTRSFDISFESNGYFDNRPRFNLDLFLFSLTLILPIKNKYENECESPKYGISYFDGIFWIRFGMDKYWTIYSPFSLQWVRTSILKKDGSYEHETNKNRKDFYEDKWKEIIWSESHPYIYHLNSGEIQERVATIFVKEREWRMHWFKWLPIMKKIKKVIEVEFNEEVGQNSGSWKGGVIGCSYNLLENETPLQCLRRMEIERKFN